MWFKSHQLRAWGRYNGLAVAISSSVKVFTLTLTLTLHLSLSLALTTLALALALALSHTITVLPSPVATHLPFDPRRCPTHESPEPAHPASFHMTIASLSLRYHISSVARILRRRVDTPDAGLTGGG